MATWSDLKIKLIETGDETGTWGETTNANFNNVIEQAITGSATVTFADADVVLSLVDSTELQDARALRLFLSGTTTLPRNLTVPNIQKFYIIDNDLPNNITVKNPTGAETFTVPAGTSSIVFSKGTGVVNAMSYFTGALTSFLAVITGGSIDDTPIGADTASTGAFTTLGASGNTTIGTTGANTLTINATPTFNVPVPIASGGTGQNTASLAINALVPSQTGNSGKALVTNGTSVSWGAAFVSGMIMMWSGTIATIPTGWVLCDGSSSTPDLRNRFIVGAYSDNAGVAKTTITGASTQTGGSADAIVVSHTHTATSTVTDPGHTHTVTAVSFANGGSGSATQTNSYYNGAYGTINSAKTNVTVATTNTSAGSSGTNANLVPYFALAFIMKT
jgi:hypothetical protein